jgi:N-glycosylase/DNA lyase
VEDPFLHVDDSSILNEVRKRINSPVSKFIEKKREEFISAGKSSKEKIFEELCFCILAANTSAEMGIRTQNYIRYNGFATMPQEELSRELKSCKYRFYNVRSRFISDSRWIIDELPELIRSPDKAGAREYLVANVPGIGFKEASHFLRNVGIFDFAILDKHILSILRKEFPDRPIKVNSKYWYLETEKLFIDLSKNISMEPGILDLYLWEIATGKIVK